MLVSSTRTRLEIARRSVAKRGDLIDLTHTDFREAGLAMPEELYDHAYALWRSRPGYKPSGIGSDAARERVAEFLTADGLPTGPEQIVLTAGSSVSYQLLFHALGRSRHRDTPTEHRPRIALPRPSYPLFEELCVQAKLQPAWYPLLAIDRYHPRVDLIEPVLRQKPRAIVLISPNNPTGAIYDDATLTMLVDRAHHVRVPVISDEVFSAFRPGAHLPRPAHHTATDGPLVASLNGLSKLCAAPEIKLGWIALHGAESGRDALIDTLDTLHDSLLTVSAYAEACACVFLSHEASEARATIARGIAKRRALLTDAFASITGITLEPSPAGVHTVFRIDAEIAASLFRTVDDEAIACRILEKSGIHVHPGYLYALEQVSGTIDPCFVVSCIHEESDIERAYERLAPLFS